MPSGVVTVREEWRPAPDLVRQLNAANRAVNSGARKADHIRGEYDKYSVVRNPALDVKEACHRCNNTVYPQELIQQNGLKFHKACFRCKECGAALTFNTVHGGGGAGQREDDLDVFCRSHAPKLGPGHMDATSWTIHDPAIAPKLDLAEANVRHTAGNGLAPLIDSEALQIKCALQVPKVGSGVMKEIRVAENGYKMDANAVQIAHAVSVPLLDLQGNRESVWKRSERKPPSLPPKDVIRSDSYEQNYDLC